MGREVHGPVLVLSFRYGMTDPSLIKPFPETQADPDAFEPEPILVPYDEVLASAVGHLDQLDAAVEEGTVRFSGLDGKGQAVSGAMRPRFDVCEGGTSIEVTWEVDLAG